MGHLFCRNYASSIKNILVMCKVQPTSERDVYTHICHNSFFRPSAVGTVVKKKKTLGGRWKVRATTCRVCHVITLPSFTPPRHRFSVGIYSLSVGFLLRGVEPTPNPASISQLKSLNCRTIKWSKKLATHWESVTYRPNALSLMSRIQGTQYTPFSKKLMSMVPYASLAAGI